MRRPYYIRMRDPSRIIMQKKRREENESIQEEKASRH